MGRGGSRILAIRYLLSISEETRLYILRCWYLVLVLVLVPVPGSFPSTSRTKHRDIWQPETLTLPFDTRGPYKR